MGGKCATRGRWWRVICYISLMNRWPSGSRKDISFLGATRAPAVTLLIKFFKSFPVFLSLAFKAFPLQSPSYILALFLANPRNASSAEVWYIVKLVVWWLKPANCFPRRITGGAVCSLNLQCSGIYLQSLGLHI